MSDSTKKLVDDLKISRIREMRSIGASIRDIAFEVGVSRGAVSRILNIDDVVGEKVCAKCKKLKSLNLFPRHVGNFDGRNSYCFECTRKINKAYKDRKRKERVEKLKSEYPGAQINLSKYANGTKKAWYFPESNEKICAKCGARKSTLTDFFRHSSTQDGFHSWCKLCCKEGSERSREKKYSTFEGRITTFLRTCAKSAEKRGHKCTITRQDLIDLWLSQDGLCYYSDLPMEIKPAESTSVSVERLDSNVGYTRENTVLCCNAINRMKSDFTVDEFIHFCRSVSEKFRS